MKKYTQEEYDAFPVVDGVRQCPPGDYVEIKSFNTRSHFGNGCRFGDGVWFASGSHFGWDCVFGAKSRFGPMSSFGGKSPFGWDCSFGDECRFGAGCSFGPKTLFGSGCQFWASARFGDRCRFGEDCSFGRGCSFDNQQPNRQETERKIKMNYIEISVYDGNPANSGPCAWPDTFSGKLTGGKISASAERKIVAQARKCGEYNKGDRLWLIARDQDGSNVAETTIRL